MAYTSEIEKLERRWLENPKGRNFAPLADAYRKAGEIDRAIDLCKSGLELHPDYVSAHIVYGRCLIDQKDDAGATEVFKKILDLDHENILALRILSEIAERTGEYDAGVDWLTRLISADPMNGDAAEALTRMKGKAAQAKAAPPPAEPPPAEAPAAEAPVAEAPVAEAPADLPPRLSLVDVATMPMEQPDFPLERASGSGEAVVDADQPIQADRLIEAEPELPGDGAVAAHSGSMGLETFDGIDFGGAAAPPPMEGMIADDASSAASSVEEIPVEGLARTQFEGSGMFRLDQPLLESTATPHEEPEGPPVSLPLIMPDDVEPGTAEAPLAPPPRTSRPVPIPDSAEDMSAADTDALSQAEPVVTETMAELYLQQGHRDDALRVYQALLEQRPGDARLEAKVRELEGGEPGEAEAEEAPVLTPVPVRTPASGLSLGAFLKKILGARPGAPAAEPLPERGPLPGPRVTSGATPQSLLAEAFADEPPFGPPPGSPSRPAADSLSLDAVFGDEARASLREAAAEAAPAPAAAPAKGGFSFDDFFGAGAAAEPAPASPSGPARASGASRSPRPSTRQSRPQAPAEDAGDLDQFQAWLKGLKS